MRLREETNHWLCRHDRWQWVEENEYIHAVQSGRCQAAEKRIVHYRESPDKRGDVWIIRTETIPATIGGA